MNNRVTDYGGVAFVEDCDFTVRGGTFRGNYAADSSGVLHSMLWSTVTIAGGVFADNRAAVLGGVLTTRRGGAVTITGGTFENNSAASGGVAMIYEGTLDVSGGIFRGNSATFGGAINVQDAVAVTGGVFERNYGHFGGVFFTADYIEFYETESIYASLDWAGGAFRNNSGFFGGVLYAAATAQTAYALQDGDGNAATIGGVVYCATDCVLRGPATLSRSVAADGGAVALGGSVAATVANVTFDANAAARGGDVFLRADAVATLDGVASSGARARVSAGFAWVGGRSVLRLYNATVADAKAQLRGGCLALDVSADIDVSDSTLSGCLALEGGAVYAVGAGALAVARVTFAGVVGSIGAVVYASTLERHGLRPGPDPRRLRRRRHVRGLRGGRVLVRRVRRRLDGGRRVPELQARHGLRRRRAAAAGRAHGGGPLPARAAVAAHLRVPHGQARLPPFVEPDRRGALRRRLREHPLRGLLAGALRGAPERRARVGVPRLRRFRRARRRDVGTRASSASASTAPSRPSSTRSRPASSCWASTARRTRSGACPCSSPGPRRTAGPRRTSSASSRTSRRATP